MKKGLLYCHSIYEQLAMQTSFFFETGYGETLGIADAEYVALGCHVNSREDVLRQDIICEPKIGDSEFLGLLTKGHTVFGWVHAEKNEEIARKLLASEVQVYAWENMNFMSRHCFWENNELAGEAAIIHAFQLIGAMPYNARVAILGRGNVSRGAQRVLLNLGAEVNVYSRNQERLFKKRIGRLRCDCQCGSMGYDACRSYYL
ncbi:hypothetical protein [Listeria cornellensis]|uniref:hypothetical protein n=1 Tax=Listeria cornellensis TaxID=1494961 RepID=UPI0004B011DB|nr:hypothetical protein [Listeria cornellensis]